MFDPRSAFVLGWALGLMGLLLSGLLGCTRSRAMPVPTVPLGPSASPTPAFTATSPVRPSVTPSATPSPSPSPTPACPVVGILEAPVSLPPLQPGTIQTLRWRLENQGSCAWSLPLQAQPVGEGTPPVQSVSVDTEASVIEPGEQVTVRLQFAAPAQPGRYHLAWALRTALGKTLGPLPPVTLEVLRPTPTPTWSPPILVQRQITLRQGHMANFDDGAAEIAYDVKSETDQALGHVGRYVYFYQTFLWPPDFAQCYHAPYEQLRFNSIPNPHWRVGTAYCYITNEGRVGAFRIDDAYTYQGEWYVVLTYITWAVFR